MPYKQYAAVYNAPVTSLKDKKVDEYHYLALEIITVIFAIYQRIIQNFLVKSILVPCAPPPGFQNSGKNGAFCRFLP